MGGSKAGIDFDVIDESSACSRNRFEPNTGENDQYQMQFDWSLEQPARILAHIGRQHFGLSSYGMATFQF